MYAPSETILQKYADVLVNFGLRQGQWIKPGDVVFVQIPECAKPMYMPLQKAILQAGGHPIFEYLPDGVAKHFYEHASDDQITFYPEHLLHGKVKQMTHIISIIADDDLHELRDVDPKKLSARMKSRKPYIQKRHKKENEWKLSRTLALYGTPAMAAEANLSIEAYREEIIKACYLDQPNPIETNKKTVHEIQTICQKLDALKIQSVYVTWPDVNLHVKIWSDRKRVGGRGVNIPSFEIFTSPDWRGTNWRIKFNQPLYRHGQLITWISLTFKDGLITHFDATQNKELLTEIIRTPNANKVWEFSLTDGRFSHITKFMAETLYDENRGGPEGNTHIAIGNAYVECRTWDVTKMTKKDMKEFWFNESVEHVDIVSTAPRKVVATLPDGSTKVIYEHGKFTV